MKEGLLLESVTKSFGGLKAVNNVSLSVERGHVLGIIGPNASGKTTLLNIVSGFIKPDAGKIVYEGQIVTHLATHQRANRGIGRLFQQTRVFAKLTIMENLLLARRSREEERIMAAFIKTSSMKKRMIAYSDDCRRWIEFV